jgi:hypothetical protein
MALEVEEIVDGGVHAQGHCHVNDLSLPSSSLSPDFGAGQQAPLGFTDRAPPATDSYSIPRRLKLMRMPARSLRPVGGYGQVILTMPS